MGGILSWIPAISTVAYVILTSWLILENRRMVKLMLKDRERPVIKEKVQKILTPLINQLKKELHSLDKGEYGWNHRGKRMENILPLKKSFYGVNKLLLSDFLREYSEIDEQIDRHDLLVDTLNKKLIELDNTINSEYFRTECTKMIEEYNAKLNELRERYKEAGSISSLSDNNYRYIIKYVIENVRDLGPAYGMYAFWREYGSDLLRVRDEGDIKAILDEVDEVVNELKRESAGIKEKITKIREDYRKTYHLLAEELGEEKHPCIM